MRVRAGRRGGGEGGEKMYRDMTTSTQWQLDGGQTPVMDYTYPILPVHAGFDSPQCSSRGLHSAVAAHIFTDRCQHQPLSWPVSPGSVCRTSSTTVGGRREEAGVVERYVSRPAVAVSVDRCGDDIRHLSAVNWDPRARRQRAQRHRGSSLEKLPYRGNQSAIGILNTACHWPRSTK